MWGPSFRRGVFTSYWLIGANSDPTSGKWRVVGAPHKCSKILAPVSWRPHFVRWTFLDLWWSVLCTSCHCDNTNRYYLNRYSIPDFKTCQRAGEAKGFHAKVLSLRDLANSTRSKCLCFAQRAGLSAKICFERNEMSVFTSWSVLPGPSLLRHNLKVKRRLLLETTQI
jgi:hypothetical protein